MIILFYIFSIISIASVVCMIISNHPVYALLYLICSLLFISCNLFFFNAPFAGVIEVIVYTGAIMVLFLFFIMMIDMKNSSVYFFNEDSILFLCKSYCVIVLLGMSLLGMLLTFVLEIRNCFINIMEPAISIKQIGISLFGPYMLIVEMASMLLLSALISVLHISSYQVNHDHNNKFTNF